jgi:hypothetical protein
MRNLLIKNFADEAKRTIRVATHPGWDADNLFSVSAVLVGLLGEWEYNQLFVREGWTIEVVHTVKAGEYLPGYINIDTGGELVISPRKVIIDHHQDPNLRNTLDAALNVGLHLEGLEDIVQLLDNPAAVPLDCLSILHRQVVELYANEAMYDEYMAHLIVLKNGPLLPEWASREVSPEWGEKIRKLEEGFQKERLAAEAALDRGEKVGDLLVVREFIPNGAARAYRRGYKYYLSIAPHKAGGFTFSLTGRESLPEDLLKVARVLGDRYPQAVYISAKGDMVVVGGPKAPDIKLPEEVVEEFIAAIKAAVMAR